MVPMVPESMMVFSGNANPKLAEEIYAWFRQGDGPESGQAE